jgi:hypothetical protein
LPSAEAQVEASWKTQLIEALKPLKNDVGVEIWHDGMLLPGDPWHPKILSALADADLVILLVSRAFLESQYARETEVPLAVERADAGRSRLVPIILDSCDWAKQPFAKYQALPGDRVPIAERSDIVHALNDCLERLRRVFDPAVAKYGGGAPGMDAWDGDYRALLDWWCRLVTADIRGRVQFPADVAAAHGPRALMDPPQVVVGTIHSVKGGQADVVYLFPDLSQAGDSQYNRAGVPHDSVIRVFYVGVTRARETLYICQRETGMAVTI